MSAKPAVDEKPESGVAVSPLVASIERDRRRRRRRSRIAKYGGTLVLLLVWEFGLGVNELFLVPQASEVAIAAVELVASGEIIRALWISNQALLIGVPLALLVGIPIGIALGRVTVLDRIFGVYVDIALVTPMVALIPLVIIVLGLSLSARATVVWLFAVVIVIANVRTGARSVDPRLIEMAQAFDARGRDLWMKVLLPGMLPALGATLRLALTRGVVGMVIVELTLVSVGLGGLLINARALFHADVVFAATAFVLVEGLVLVRVGKLIERRVAPQGLYGTSA